MKVALIGNMNNNNFALMRYFRDLGVDAHLLLFQDDGKGSRSHFCPENDTWEIDKWDKYIHRMPIWSSFPQILNRYRFYRIIFFFAFIIKKLLKQVSAQHYRPPSLLQVKNAFKGYDKYIGSGTAPALFYQMNINLDIFYPYSMGIECVGEAFFVDGMNNGGIYQRKSYNKVCEIQKLGIKDAFHCVSMELSTTGDEFGKLGVDYKKIAIPMVYNREQLGSIDKLSNSLLQLKSELDQVNFKIINHSRMLWVKPSTFDDAEWAKHSKNNHWLIKGYAALLKLRPQLNCRLIIVEYGQDFLATQTLAQELGIQDKITWLPLMSRREIMQLLSLCDVAVGEFLSEPILWGGTGWEALSVGCALLQGFHFSEEEFESIYGYPAPPLLAVRSESDIIEHLINMADHPKKCQEIGEHAKIWFDRYNGIGLAKQWLNLLGLSSSNSEK